MEDFSDVKKHILKDLEKFVGKKLVWAGWDTQAEAFSLVFDDLSTIVTEELAAVPKGFAEAYLNLNLEKAEKTLALKVIADKANNGQLPLLVDGQHNKVGGIQATQLYRKNEPSPLTVDVQELPDFGEAAHAASLIKELRGMAAEVGPEFAKGVDKGIRETVVKIVPDGHTPLISEPPLHPQGELNVPQGTNQ